MPRAVLLALAALSLGFAPAPFLKSQKLRAAEAELAALDGDWELVSYNENGEEKEVEPGGVLTCSRGEVTEFLFGERASMGTVSLDPTKNPKAIDVDLYKAGFAKSLGIYRLDGGHLVCCLAYPPLSPDRPGAFEAGEGRLIAVFKRKKV
jgi:uncharacterized protein (TIGR03067 family)